MNCDRFSSSGRNCPKLSEATRKLFEISSGPQNLGKSRHGSCPGDRDRCPEQFPAPQRFWEPYNRPLSPPIFSTSFGTVSDSFRQFRTVSHSFGRKSKIRQKPPHTAPISESFPGTKQKTGYTKVAPGQDVHNDLLGCAN